MRCQNQFKLNIFSDDKFTFNFNLSGPSNKVAMFSGLLNKIFNDRQIDLANANLQFSAFPNNLSTY